MSLKSKLIRMALKRENGNSIFPCGQKTTLSECYFEEPIVNKACFYYNVSHHQSTLAVTTSLS